MNIHSENRDQLINFLKTDLIGPMTDNPNIEFEEIDTSNKIIFENIEATKSFLKIKKQVKRFYICLQATVLTL